MLGICVCVKYTFFDFGWKPLKLFVFVVSDSDEHEEPRILGLAMVPGHHIVSLHVDEGKQLSPQVI